MRERKREKKDREMVSVQTRDRTRALCKRVFRICVHLCLMCVKAILLVQRKSELIYWAVLRQPGAFCRLCGEPGLHQGPNVARRTTLGPRKHSILY